MTSVPFELNVTITNESTGKRESFEQVEFRFGTKEARAVERAAGTGIYWLRASGRSVEALVLLVCYGLQQTYPKMTEKKAEDVIDAFLDRGGSIKALSDATTKALNASGLYGEVDKDLEADSSVPLETKTEAIQPQPSVTG